MASLRAVLFRTTRRIATPVPPAAAAACASSISTPATSVAMVPLMHRHLNYIPCFQIGTSTNSSPNHTSTRSFSSKKGGNTNDGDGDGDEDPFGVNFQDGTDLGKLGPTSPPKYKRDAVTGKFTGEQEEELTPQEKKLLKMDPIEEQDYVVDKVLKEWDIETDESFEEPVRLTRLAQRIREDNMGLNTLGRSVQAQSFRGTLEDGEDAYADETGFSKPLSPAEFDVFRKHMKEEYGMDITEDDIPVEPTNSNTDRRQKGDVLSSDDSYADNDQLTAQWMSSSAMRFMDDTKDDDPFSDLLPSDLSPSRLVNRRQAKPIPRQLLHHNNLALLRRYITPSGQIMNRVQSRLGAKDQRRMAKLIKRARHLGLIPTSGQFIVEAHGNIHEEDIHEDREWEKELKRRGLVVKGPSEK
jgi:ribosomal protein S18